MGPSGRRRYRARAPRPTLDGVSTTTRCRPTCGVDAPPAPGPAASPGSPTARTARTAPVPGLLAVAAATFLALGLAHLLPSLNPATTAVVLGVLVANLGLHAPTLHAGTHVASHRLLRLAVVLLGLRLGVPQLLDLGPGGAAVVATTVAVTFTGTRLLGRLLGVPPARALLVATGFSICGASAVAAMEDVAGGEEDDTAVAVALVTLCGSLAIVLLPLLRGPLGLDPAAFGAWVGASVHDVGQTVATANRVPGALTTAVVVKLSRVVLLAPLVATVAVGRRRAAPSARAVGGRRPALVPVFVLGFLAAVAVASTGLVPAPALEAAQQVQEVLLTAALFGLGTGIDLRALGATGGRSLALGLLSWLLVGGVAYLGVRLVGV